MKTEEKVYLMNCARLKKRKLRDEFVKGKAEEEFKKYKNNSLFLSGVALYWAEGTRLNNRYRKYQLALTNSDEHLLSFYCRFLKKYFQNSIQDWRGELFLYPDINQARAVSHWSEVLGIPDTQFIKSQILESKNTGTKKLEFGTCRVYLNSKDACLTMQTWINSIHNNAAVIQR